MSDAAVPARPVPSAPPVSNRAGPNPPVPNTVVPNTVVALTDADDPRVADYRSLTDAALRRRQDLEHGMYMAESSQVVRRAVAAGHRPRSFFMEHRHLEQLADVVARWPDAPVYLGDEAVLEAITGFHLHRGALAAMHRPPQRSLEEILAGAGTVLVLEGITDHTNVGAIFRSAAALGVDGILLSPTCADPLYRRSIRVSMGSVLTMPWTRLPRDSADGSWTTAAAGLHDAGFELLALEVTEDAVGLTAEAIASAPRLALVLGAEGPGVRQDTLEVADRRVLIPMPGAESGAHALSLDSLNVAAAAAVACWELGRRPGLG